MTKAELMRALEEAKRIIRRLEDTNARLGLEQERAVKLRDQFAREAMAAEGALSGALEAQRRAVERLRRRDDYWRRWYKQLWGCGPETEAHKKEKRKHKSRYLLGDMMEP